MSRATRYGRQRAVAYNTRPRRTSSVVLLHRTRIAESALDRHALFQRLLIMLSYRHAFHAGNHADVLKHAVVLQLLRYLGQKDKAYWYIDTHAGAGVY